jgi:hypothetical protein
MSNPRKFYASLEYEFIINNKQDQEVKEEKLDDKDNKEIEIKDNEN